MPEANNTVSFWEFGDGVLVTILEVDALRSYANWILEQTDDLGPPDPNATPDEQADRYAQGVLRGYFFGLAREDDEALAQTVAKGRRIRKAAGDEPVQAEAYCVVCQTKGRPSALQEGRCQKCHDLEIEEVCRQFAEGTDAP